MKKGMKCYGRQKTVVLKEKSFITNFFDGNESSDISLFNICSNKRLQADCYAEDKENITSNVLHSPALFQDSLHEDINERCLEQKSFKVKKNAKAVSDAKQYKQPKPKKNVRKKPKQIQHLSTKFCKSLQPRWSEFYKHDFTIDKSEKHSVFPVKLYGNKNRRSKTPESITTERSTGLRDNTNKINVYQSSVSSKTHICAKNLTTPNTKDHSVDSLNSSGDLFLQNCKKRKKNVKKKLKNKEYVHNHKKKCNIELVNIITEQHKENDRRIINPETNEMNSKEQKDEVQISQQLDNFSGSFEKDVNISPIEDHERKKDCRITTFKSSFNNMLSELENIPHKQICRNSTHLSVTEDVLKTIKNNITNINFESFEHSKNLNSEIAFRDVQNSSNLLQNVSRHQGNAPGNDNCSVSISKELCTENDSVKRKLSLLFKVDVELNDCSSSITNNVIASKISQNVNLRSSRSDKNLKPSSNLLVDNCSPNKEENTYNQESNLNSVQNTKLKDHSSYSNALFKLKNLHLETSHSFNDQIVTDCSREEDNTAKKVGNFHKPLNLAGFSPDISNGFRYSNLITRKGICHFVTSTPVEKWNRKTSLSRGSFELTHSNKEIKSIASNSDSISAYGKETEVDKFLLNNSADKSYHDMHSASLVLLHHKMSLQFEENLVTFIKSLTTPKKPSATSASLRRNRSLLNVSSNLYDMPHEISEHFLKAELLKLCSQDCIGSFADIYDWNNLNVRKIGEGSYGEVFMVTQRKYSSVLKIIPISSEAAKNSQQSLQSILSEIQISKCLSELRNNKHNQTKNFVKVNRTHIVSGVYPSSLLKAWDNFDNSCYNDRPDFYPDDQLYAILELEYGGKDMVHFQLKNSLEAEIILKQVMVSLAIAEEEFLFEHRDLHLGNVLVERKKKKRVSYTLRGKNISFACYGLHVTIIDFTLSCLYKDGYIYYNDLENDLSLFDQTGDIQYNVYRCMRERLERQWQECTLYSNVLWLKYLCQKFQEFKYSHPASVANKKGLQKIESFNSYLMDCNCALDSLTKCGITEHMFERIVIDQDLTKKSILVSRNSSQKSNLCN